MHSGSSGNQLPLKTIRSVNQLFSQATWLHQRLRDGHGTALAHHDLGSLLVLNGDRETSAAEYLEAIKQFEILGDRNWHAKSLLGLAKIVTNHTQAAGIIERLVHQKSADRSLDVPADELTDISVRLGLVETVGLAVDCERASRARTELKTWPWRISMLGALAMRYGHWPLAEKLLTKALSHHDDSSPRELVAKIQNDLGIAQMNQDKTAAAIRRFKRGLSFGKQMHNRAQIAQSSHNLGEAYRRTGRYELAAAFLRESLAAARAIGDTDMQADSWHSLSLANCAAGRYKGALVAAGKLQSIARQSGNAAQLAYAAANLGTVASLQSRFARAYSQFRTAARLFGKANRAKEEIIAIHDMGLMSIQLGRPQLAANLLMRSAKMASESSDWSMLSTSLRTQSTLAAQHGTATQTAALLATALFAAVNSHDQEWSLTNTVEIYFRCLELLVAHRATTGRSLLNSVMLKLGRSKTKSAVEFIKRHLEAATEYWERRQ